MDELTRLVHEHEEILRGESGLSPRLKTVENAQKDFLRAMWIIISPVLLAIGGGIVYLVRMASDAP